MNLIVAQGFDGNNGPISYSKHHFEYFYSHF